MLETATGQARPIFIIGAPRSGTSVTTWVLGQLPNVQTVPETAWIASLAAGAFQAYELGSSRGKFSHLSNAHYRLEDYMAHMGEAVQRIAMECFWERAERNYGNYRETGKLERNAPNAHAAYQIMRAVDDPKQRWADGTPYNTFFLWGLDLLFPHARYIHNLRAPADVATSLEGFDNLGAEAQELKDGLETWRLHVERAALAERAFGRDKVFRLDFARIKSAPEPLFRELCAFLGEEFSPHCLDPLSVRINSSDVDERREDNMARLMEMPEFVACDALHRDLLAAGVPPQPDPAAMNELKQQFIDYGKRHPLY